MKQQRLYLAVAACVLISFGGHGKSTAQVPPSYVMIETYDGLLKAAAQGDIPAIRSLLQMGQTSTPATHADAHRLWLPPICSTTTPSVP